MGFESVRKKFDASRVTLYVSLAMLVASGLLYMNFMNPRQLLPESKLRFDVTEVGVAVLEGFCQNPGSLNIQRAEECAKSLEEAKEERFTKLEIPTLDQILDKGRPNFSNLLRSVDTSLYQKLIVDGQYFVLKVDIPRKYFTDKALSPDYYELLFSYARNTLFCIEGRCFHPVNYSSWSANTVPLLLADGDSTTNLRKEFVSVYALGGHIEWNYLLSLRDGFFVAKNTDLSYTKRYYSLTMNSNTLVYSLVLCGVLFFLVWSSIVWKKYRDFSSLLFLGSSFVLTALAERAIAHSFASSDYFTRFWLDTFLWMNAAASSVMFALSTLRSRGTLARNGYLICMSLGLVISGLAFAYLVYFSSAGRSAEVTSFIFSVVATLIAPAICLYGGLVCSRELKNARLLQKRASDILALSRRTRQQVLLAAALFAMNYPSFLNIFRLTASLGAESVFTPLSALGYLCVFLLLIRPSMLRLKHAVEQMDNDSEANRMRLLLGQRQYGAWKAEERRGVFIEVDLKGSTYLVDKLQGDVHLIMKILKASVLADLSRKGRVNLLSKPMGDAWVFIVELRRGESMSDALNEIVLLMRDEFAKYNEIVQETTRELLRIDGVENVSVANVGVHLRAFSCEKFSLRSNSRMKVEELSVAMQRKFSLNVETQMIESEVDFIGSDSHTTLRLLPKAPRGSISVALAERDRHLFLNSHNLEFSPLTTHQDISQPVGLKLEDRVFCYIQAQKKSEQSKDFELKASA